MASPDDPYINYITPDITPEAGATTFSASDAGEQATDTVVARHLAAGAVVAVNAYDSANWKNIPRDAKAVLPYSDGRYAFNHKAFPQAWYRYISVLGGSTGWQHASIIDIEPGCVWPPSKARFAVEQRQKHFGDACVYCFRSAVPAIKSALGGLKYKAIISTLDGTILKSYQGWTLSGCQYQGGVSAAYDKTIIFDRSFLHAP